MPNYIKALILVLIATSIIMYFVRDPLSSHFQKREIRSYQYVWWFLTASLFISPDIWVFYAIVFLVLITRKYATDVDRVAAYLFLLFTAPSIEAAIPGPGGINKLFDLDLQRILVLMVLLPLFKKSLQGGISVNPPDKYVVLYVLVTAAGTFRGDNMTEALRDSLMMVVDIIIPYFVISRTMKSVYDLNRVLLALMFTLSLLAAEAVMEAARHWELYNSVGERLIGERVFRFSGERAGILRARSIFLSPIILGLVMIVLMALLLYLKPYFKRKSGYYVIGMIAGTALLVTFSRAAWVGGVVLVAVYTLTANGVARATWYMALSGLIGFVVLTTTQFGKAILNLLPFFGGTARADTFDYRARLLENGIILVKRNPLFGSHTYLQTPEMQELRQGQGIIDTVNAFLAIAMRYGLVGLFFFLMIFIPSLVIIYRGVKHVPDNQERLRDLGRMLLSMMVAVLLVISTVSNVDFVSVTYYLGAAFMAAWIGIYRDVVEKPRGSEIVVRRSYV
jgi:uncharacterized membrane protein (Fun14 family)